MDKVNCIKCEFDNNTEYCDHSYIQGKIDDYLYWGRDVSQFSKQYWNQGDCFLYKELSQKNKKIK